MTQDFLRVPSELLDCPLHWVTWLAIPSNTSSAGWGHRIQENRSNGSFLMEQLGSAAKSVGQVVRPLARNSADAVTGHGVPQVAGSSAAMTVGQILKAVRWFSFYGHRSWLPRPSVDGDLNWFLPQIYTTLSLILLRFVLKIPPRESIQQPPPQGVKNETCALPLGGAEQGPQWPFPQLVP